MRNRQIILVVSVGRKMLLGGILFVAVVGRLGADTSSRDGATGTRSLAILRGAKRGFSRDCGPA